MRFRIDRCDSDDIRVATLAVGKAGDLRLKVDDLLVAWIEPNGEVWLVLDQCMPTGLRRAED